MRIDTRYYRVIAEKKITYIATIRDVVVATNAEIWTRERKWIGQSIDWMDGMIFGIPKAKMEYLDPKHEMYQDAVKSIGEVKTRKSRSIINDKIKGLTFGEQWAFFRKRSGLKLHELATMISKNDTILVTGIEADDPIVNPTLKTIEEVGRILGFKISLKRDRGNKVDARAAFKKIFKKKKNDKNEKKRKQRIKVRPSATGL